VNFKITLFVVVLHILSTSFSFAAAVTDPLALDTFSFDEPRESDLGDKLNLWATYYNLPQLDEASGNFPLRDKLGNELGPRLTNKGWCDAAMEGSVLVNYKNGDKKTFNYAGTSAEYPTSCKDYFKLDLSKTKFREASGPYGDGIDQFILEPYRTIATDNTKIIPGTVLYIPQAKGAIIKLKSGRTIMHDGYFFAGDKGGAIKGNHVDVFIGTHVSANFFPWVGSNQTKTFDAYIVKDQNIISELLNLHAK
jgi:3D (Asp-Asp-Asp) domain-containing protein